MAARRASATAAERVNLGDAYQIYSEIVNVGKNLEGSKKKIRWVFGFTESDQEYEVVMIHSVVSGKKTILEDGREIVSTINMLQSDFSHGWTSVKTHRFFRIEANMGLTQDSYTFSIDGIRFIDMQKKPVGGFKRGETNSRYGAGETTGNGSATRRASTGSATTTSSGGAKPTEHKPLKPVNSDNNFDPFENSGPTSSFDPFADSSPATKATPAANLFSNPEPSNASKSSNNFDPFSNNHDPFSSQSATSSASKPKNEGFGGGNFDPFSSPSSAPASNSNGFSNFPAPNQAAKSQTNSPSNNDLFAFDNQPSGNTTSKPQRRASAQEISMDFAGLSFAAEQPKKEVQSPPVAAPVVEQPVVEKKPETVDPWATNLVDLDLTGKAQTQRRQSTTLNSGPTLDNLMGANPNPQRRASMGTGNLSNNDILSSYQQPSNDPFGAPNGVMRPAPTPISAMGMQPIGVGPNGYAAPIPPQNVRGSINMGQPMMMQPPALGPMGGMPMNTRASFTSNVPLTNNMGYAAQPPQTKNSLDSLDWRM